MTELTYDEPAREMGYDQTAVPGDEMNTTPQVKPTVDSVERACAEEKLEEELGKN